MKEPKIPDIKSYNISYIHKLKEWDILAEVWRLSYSQAKWELSKEQDMEYDSLIEYISKLLEFRRQKNEAN